MSTTIKTGVPMNLGTLDTMRIGCDDSIKNGVNIPISPEYCKREYADTYKAIQQQVTGYMKGDINLDLHVIAKPGHEFYCYDGEYDYYYAAYIMDENGQYTLIQIPAILTDEDRDTVNKMVYRNRDTKKMLRAITAKNIKETYLNEFALFIDGLQKNSYCATWQTADGNGAITIQVSGLDTGECKTQIQAYGNVKYKA